MTEFERFVFFNVNEITSLRRNHSNSCQKKMWKHLINNFIDEKKGMQLGN